MATTHLDTEAGPPSLTIADELTFQTAADIRAALLKAFDAADEALVVDLSAVESFDLCGVQLLYAAARTADERGVALRIDYGANADRFAGLFRFAGLRPLQTGATG
jgi:anti-anti-sigma factor